MISGSWDASLFVWDANVRLFLLLLPASLLFTYIIVGNDIPERSEGIPHRRYWLIGDGEG